MTKPMTSDSEGVRKIIDFNSFSGGFELLVDTGKGEPIACIVLSFPNDTQVTIRGDEEVVKQIVDRLDGVNIEYTQKRRSS